MKNSISKKFVALFCLLISSLSHACKIRADYKSPTLKENYNNAAAVVLATFKKQEPFKVKTGNYYEEEHKMTFEIKKQWKGSLAKEEVLIAGPSSSCDTFAQWAEASSTCVLFIDQNKRIISGVLSGDSSVCVPGNSPRAQKLEAEYSALFK